MTSIHLNLNNFSEFESLLSLFPSSDEFEFTSKKVFRRKIRVVCCDEPMVHNGHDIARKQGFGNVKIGKQLCKSCNAQHHENKGFWKNLLAQWQETTTNLIMTLRDSHVSWDAISKVMNFLVPLGKSKAMNLFNNRVEQFEYPQDNYAIICYDEQHPKKGRMQKFRLTLLNYETKVPIADELFDNKNEDTIKEFLQRHLDTTKELIIITDCDRRYPEIFKELWGKNLVHQKCLLHLNKLVVKDFDKNTSLQNLYNLYLILNVFYNRKKELKFLERLIKKYEKKIFASSKENKEWVKKAKQKFRDYVKNLEHKRRREKKNLSQRPLWKATQLFEELWKQQMLFSKRIKARLKMIKNNWKYFTAFYHVKDCPATNNSIENFYSTSLKTHRKKQLRTDNGLINHMKLAALKRVEGFSPKKTLLEIYGLIRLIRN